MLAALAYTRKGGEGGKEIESRSRVTSIFGFMDVNKEGQSRRWKIVREQLITLSALDSKSSSARECDIFLTECLDKCCINLNTFNQICYFLFGLINKEERDKLIKWPIVDTQGQVNFRKALSKMVKDLVDKYPFLHMKKLPDSYLMDPNQNQEKILDFIMRLSNVAIYLAVNDPFVFPMADTKNLNADEIEIATNIIKEARLNEESEIENIEFPLSQFENQRITFVNECVHLKEENFDLKKELNFAKQCLYEKGIIEREDSSLNCLMETYQEKLNEQKEMNKELEPYSKIGQEIIKSVNAVENPIQLTKEDFGLTKESDFTHAAAEAYDGLIKTFEFIKLKDVSAEKKEEYYERLVNLRETLVNEQKVLRSFIDKCIVKNNQTNEGSF